MSEIPTFRLGRAVRNFAPVAVIAVLAVPSAAFADPGNGNGKGHGKGAEKGIGWAGPDNGKEHGRGNASDGPDRNNGNDKPGKDKPGKDKPGKPGKPGKGPDKPAQPQAPAAAPQQAVAPAAVVTTSLPSRAKVACASRRTITITIGRKSDIRRNSVRINGKKASTRIRNGKVVALVDLRKMPKGIYTIKTRATMKDGDVKTGTRRYRTCTPKQIAAEKAAKRKAAKRKGKARRS